MTARGHTRNYTILTDAILAEQLGAAIIDGHLFNIRQVERAVFNAIQDIIGHSRFDVFGYEGRRTIVELLRLSEDVAREADGLYWLRAVADEAGAVLVRGGWIPPAHKADFSSSVAEMIEDMQRNDVDVENLTIEDLGMFASPDKALRLMTIHEAKGREFAAVAIIGVKEGSFPYYKAKTHEEVEAEKRQFYVAVTRAEQLLMYIYDRDCFGNPPSRFLGPDGVNILR